MDVDIGAIGCKLEATSCDLPSPRFLSVLCKLLITQSRPASLQNRKALHKSRSCRPEIQTFRGSLPTRASRSTGPFGPEHAGDYVISSPPASTCEPPFDLYVAIDGEAASYVMRLVYDPRADLESQASIASVVELSVFGTGMHGGGIRALVPYDTERLLAANVEGGSHMALSTRCRWRSPL
jgi:hypothetical protein